MRSVSARRGSTAASASGITPLACRAAPAQARLISGWKRSDAMAPPRPLAARPVGDHLPECHSTGARRVGQGPGPEDDPVQVARGQGDVGGSLHGHVVLETLGALTSASGVHEDRDQHEPSDAGDPTCRDRLLEATAVDGSGQVEAGAVRAGAENDGVVSGHPLRDGLCGVPDEVPVTGRAPVARTASPCSGFRCMPETRCPSATRRAARGRPTPPAAPIWNTCFAGATVPVKRYGLALLGRLL